MTDYRAVVALAAIFALRMAGLFLLLPVLAVYAAGLPAATPVLVGLALGVYGLTQGLLQIPFGVASDRFGRKRVIAAGLVVFAAGSVVAATADGVAGLIAGRALQGAGAVSAAALALTADLTDADHRTRAMAVIGVSIGAVFLISLAVAPPLAAAIGVAGIFWLTAALATAALAVLYFVVPSPPLINHTTVAVGTVVTTVATVATDRRLRPLNLGAFALHFILTALFVTLPPQLVAAGVPLADHWRLYAPVLAASVVGMAPLVWLADRRPRGSLTAAVALLVVAAVALAVVTDNFPLVTDNAAVVTDNSAVVTDNFPLLTAGVTVATATVALLTALCLFFVAFNALEAILPARVSRCAPAAATGAAIGVYNTCQFLGMFAGGVVAGFLGGVGGGVYWLCAAVAAAWLVVAVGEKNLAPPPPAC